VCVCSPGALPQAGDESRAVGAKQMRGPASSFPGYAAVGLRSPRRPTFYEAAKGAQSIPYIPRLFRKARTDWTVTGAHHLD
jgi:hypothetical protein